MNSFQWKVLYIALMAVLLLPVSYISRPSTPPRKGGESNPGGWLAQKRAQYNLAQANLGEIDPASETMKLALLGMRGVAANILWTKANHYKKTEDWPKMMATLEQITNLQPNFISVWQFQGWNVSYNVSVEFDNYLHRYFWVKRGIRFLIEGTRYNRDEPRLLWDVAWFFGQKIGRADEHKQFREEFRKDDDFHDFIRDYVIDFDNKSIGPFNKPDNWRVSHQWYLIAQETVDSGRATMRGRSLQSMIEEKPHERNKGKSPVLFHSGPGMALINYSAALADEGIFDEFSESAWAEAGAVWQSFGNREIRTSRDFYIRLNEEEALEAEVIELTQQLGALQPGLVEEIKLKKQQSLSEEMILALETPVDQVTEEQAQLHAEAVRLLMVSPTDIVEQIKDEATRSKARWLAETINDKMTHATFVKQYRGIVNFDYWRTRCTVEQSEDANQAKKHLYQADNDHREGRLLQAQRNYEIAWDAWANIYEKYPQLQEDVGTEDVVSAVKRYDNLLGQLDQEFPADFKLKRVVDFHERGRYRPWEEMGHTHSSDHSSSSSEGSTLTPSLPVAPDEGTEPGKQEPPEDTGNKSSADPAIPATDG